MLEVADLPLFRRHHTGNFVRQVDAGFLAKSQSRGVFCDAVDAEFFRQRVEENIAGLVDRFFETHRSVAAFHPTAKTAAIEFSAPDAVHVKVLRNPLLPSGNRHDDFESGTRRQLRLNRFVQQRLVRIVDQLVPLVAGNADGKIIGVEGGTAHHGQNFAGVRVHGDHCSILAFHGLLGGNLEIDIEGQLKLLSGNGGGFIEASNFAPMAVDQRASRTVLSHQNRVVLPLHARNSNHVAGAIKLELRLIQHVFGDFAHVADQVRHESVARIQAPVRHDGIQFRQLIAVRVDEGQFVGSDVFFKKNRLILRHGGEVANARPHFVGIEMQAFRNQIAVGIQVARRITQEQSGKRGVVVDNRSPFAVENFSPWRENGHVADAIFFRQRGVKIALHHLEPPQAIGEQQEDAEDDILRRRQADRRYFFVAAKHRKSVISGQLPVTSGAITERSSGSQPITASQKFVSIAQL